MENRNIIEIIGKAARRRRLKKWVALMSVVVLFVTTNRLILLADALEPGVSGGAIYEDDIIIEETDSPDLLVEDDGQAISDEIDLVDEGEEIEIDLPDLAGGLAQNSALLEDVPVPEEEPSISGDLRDFIDDARLVGADEASTWDVLPGETYTLRLHFSESNEMSFDRQELRYALPEGVSAAADFGETSGVYGEYVVEDGSKLTVRCVFEAGDNDFSMDVPVMFESAGLLDFGRGVRREAAFVEAASEDLTDAPRQEAQEPEAEQSIEEVEQPAEEAAPSIEAVEAAPEEVEIAPEEIEQPASEEEEVITEEAEQPVEKEETKSEEVEQPVIEDEETKPEEVEQPASEDEETEPEEPATEKEEAAEVTEQPSEEEGAAFEETEQPAEESEEPDIPADEEEAIPAAPETTEETPESVDSEAIDGENTDTEDIAIEDAPAALRIEIDLAEVVDYPLSMRALLGDAIVDADAALLPVAYDAELVAVETIEDDYLVTPVADFDAAVIEIGPHAVTLLNYRSAPAYPAQSFADSTAYVTVSVTADAGAFPAGTTMTLTDIDDAGTIDGITEKVEEDFVKVERVHAVDITFRDADGNEIEPLIPISVVMTVREIEDDLEAMVVHVDTEGEAQVVEDAAPTGEAETPASSSVEFTADSFSVYAVVVAQKIETKVIAADGKTYRIEVTYAEDADIPAGATLSVAEVTGEEAYLEQARENIDKYITLARFFDIKIMNDGEEVRLGAPVEVRVWLDEADVAGDATPVAVHFAQTGVETQEAREADDAVVFRADGFSVWGVAYTVDFEYYGNTYSFAGGTWVWLSDVLEELRADFTVYDLENVSFTDESLLAVEYVEGDEPETAGMYDWRLTSLQPFSSHEALTLTTREGKPIVINVTDATDEGQNNYHKDMNALLVDGSLKLYVDGEEVPKDATVYVRDGMLYELSFQLKEAGVNQFYNQNEDNPDHLYFQLPDGFVLPDDYRDTLVINLGLDGKVYGNTLSYDKENNRLLLDWNKADRKYQRLIAAGNLRFTMTLSGYITPGDVKYAGETMCTALRYDPHNASVTKTGTLDASDLENQVITYTVKVMSDGSTENLTMTDVLGSALSYVMKDGVPHVTWARENIISSLQNERLVTNTLVGADTSDSAPYIANTAEGFLITIPSTHDGDVLTFTYKAAVDYSKIASSGAATIDEMGNTVQIYGDSDSTDNKAVYHEKEVFFSDISKTTDGPGARYKVGEKEYQNIPWHIVTNQAKIISFHGTQITDQVTQYDGNGSDEIEGVPLTYSGDGITINVYAWDEYKLERVLVETRNIPWSQLHTSDDLDATQGWAYDVPDTDGAYEYDIRYTTKAEVTNLTTDVMLRNDAHSLGGNDRATTLLHPKGSGLGIKKRVVAYNEEETTWEIVVTLDDISEGYNKKLILADCLPNKYSDTLKLSPRRDTYKAGSLKIDGLQAGESYEVYYSEFSGDGSASVDWNTRNAHAHEDWKALNVAGGNNIVFVRFYQDEQKSKDGLLPPKDGTDSRILVIQLTTYNNPEWLKDMQTEKGIRGDYLLKHQNDAYINTAHELAEVMITGKQLFKKFDGKVDWGWVEQNGLTGDDAIGFRFETYLGGVYPGEKVVIDDYFDTSLFKLVLRPASAPTFRAGNMPHYASNVVWYLNSEENYGTTVTETDYGFHVEIENPPTKPDGSMYGAYGLDYVLIPKNADALNTIQQQALEAGGIMNYVNTATSGDLSDYDTFDVELLVRFKPVSKNIPTQDDVKNNQVEYTITLNPQKMMMNNGDFMTMEDEFDNLSIDYSSIRIVTDPAGREDEISYDFSGNIGSYTIPDETKVVITYKARVTPPSDATWVEDGDAEETEVEVKNIAHMLTWQDGGKATLTVRRESAATIYRIRVFKYGSGHMEEGLNGAVFGLYQDGNEVDENGKPIKVPMKRNNGQEIIFATGDVWMLDGLIQSELKGKTVEQVNALSDNELLNLLHGDYDESNVAYARQNLRDLKGYADVQLSDDADGVHLQEGKNYYLKELTEPDGYAKDASVDYYAFRFGENAEYIDGVWQYFNSDILKVRNSPTDGAFTIRKKLDGNYALSDDQKAALRFTVQKKQADNWVTQSVEVPVRDSNGDVKYESVTELTYEQLSAGQAVTHIGAGEFRVVESIADGGATVPGSVVHTVSFTRDDIEDELTEDGGQKYVQFEITDDDIARGLEHVFEITNTYTQETVTLTAKKAWRDAENNPLTPAGAKVTFGVYALVNGEIPDGAEPVQTVVLDGVKDVNTTALTGESASWTAQFARLPKLDDAGKEIIYVVKETVGVSGYEAIYAQSGDTYMAFADGSATITNKQETVEYTVEKQWTKPYWEDESWTPPEGAKLGVYYGATAAAAYAKYTAGNRPYREIELPVSGADAADQWKASFTSLPKADGSGNEYQWILVETAAPQGFMAVYDDGDYLPLTGNGGVLKLTNRVESVDIGVNKVWSRTQGNAWPEGQSIDITVSRALIYDNGAQTDGNFNVVYTLTRNGDALTVVQKSGDAPKNWNNVDVTPVATLNAQTGRATLSLNGLPRYGSMTVGDEAKEGEWQYRFAEAEINGFDTTYSTGSGYGYALNGGTITNTRRDDEISLKKTWTEETGAVTWTEGVGIKVRLTQSFKYTEGGAEKTDTVSATEYTITRTEDGYTIDPATGLTYDGTKDRFTAGSFPKYGTRGGHVGEYVFDWEELEVTGAENASYIPVNRVDGSDAGQTNINNMKIETVGVSVTKTWLDGTTDAPSALKVPVKMRLYHKVDATEGEGLITVGSDHYLPVTEDATGAAIDLIELNADNTWSREVPLLRKYVSGTDNVEEVYIFREAQVWLNGAWTEDFSQYYVTDYTDTAEGTTVNNKPLESLTKTSVSVKKEWSDGNDQHADESSTVKLYRAVEIPADANVLNINVRTQWYYNDGKTIAPPLTKPDMTENGSQIVLVVYANAKGDSDSKYEWKDISNNSDYSYQTGNFWDTWSSNNAAAGGRLILVPNPQTVTLNNEEKNVNGYVIGKADSKYGDTPALTLSPTTSTTYANTKGVINYVLKVQYANIAPPKSENTTDLRVLAPDRAYSALPDNAVPMPDKVTLDKNNGWTYSFQNLPTTLGGYPVTYYVVEESVKTKAASVSVAYSHQGNSWTITNTPTYAEKLEIDKAWLRSDGEAAEASDVVGYAVTFDVLRKQVDQNPGANWLVSADASGADEGTWVSVGEYTVAPSQADGTASKGAVGSPTFDAWKVNLTQLPVSADGKNYVYKVVEKAVSKGEDAKDVDTFNPTYAVTGKRVEVGNTLANAYGYTLPATGGPGTTPYTAIGALLVLLATALLVAKKRKD